MTGKLKTNIVERLIRWLKMDMVGVLCGRECIQPDMNSIEYTNYIELKSLIEILEKHIQPHRGTRRSNKQYVFEFYEQRLV